MFPESLASFSFRKFSGNFSTHIEIDVYKHTVTDFFPPQTTKMLSLLTTLDQISRAAAAAAVERVRPHLRETSSATVLSK